MAESEVFAWIATELQNRTRLSRIEARGTVRLVLRQAGLDPSSVAAYQMDVVLLRLMPGALSKRRIVAADELCNALASDLRDRSAKAPDMESVDTAYDVFERLDSGGAGRKGS